MIYLAIAWVCGLHFLSVLALFRSRARNPLFLFVVFNWYFSFGTLIQLEPQVRADTEHAFLLILVSIAVFLQSTLLFNRRRYLDTERRHRRRLSLEKPNSHITLTWILLLLSFSIAFIYYTFLVGYNLFIPAIRGDDIDFTTMRLQSYAGDEYTGAGIVNQFKNTILPITLITVLFYYTDRKRTHTFIILFIFLLPAFLWVILGTGQRTFLFYSLVGFIVSFKVLDRPIPRSVVLLSPAVIGVFFGYLSFALGRTHDLSVETVISEVFHRIFDANQVGAVVGFRYVFDKETVYGAEWLQSLVGFVPGVPGSTLSNEVFQTIYGGYRGTIPVSLWTSVYYNFGFVGLFPISLALMKIIEISHSLLNRIDLSTLSLVTYSFLIFYLGITPLTPPTQILNNGALAIALIFFLIKIEKLFTSRARRLR